MANRIAFNPQDRFVVAMGNTLIVTTRSGDTFGHDVTGHTADRVFQFSGAKAAFNPEDRFVVAMGNTLIVCTRNGNVFGHEIAGRNIGPGFQFTGAKAAFNAGDRFVTTAGNLLIVCTQNGDVFGHEIAGRNIGPGFQFTGSKAAFNPGDRFVVTTTSNLFGHHTLIVCTQNGDVFGHDISGHKLGPPFKFTGSRMAFNPEDRFVVMVNKTMVVTTQSGAAFGADIVGINIGPIFRLNPDLSIHLHIKIWTGPIIPIDTMLTSMQDLYGTAGIGVVVASVEDFRRPSLFVGFNDLDVVPDCPAGEVTLEQTALFKDRNNVGESDVVAYFVRSTIPTLNGCASHPEDLVAVAVTRIASVWTLAHEVGHVMGLQHISGENTDCPDENPNCCNTQDTTRLMTGCSTSNIVGTAVIVQSEIDTLRSSDRARPS